MYTCVHIYIYLSLACIYIYIHLAYIYIHIAYIYICTFGHSFTHLYSYSCTQVDLYAPEPKEGARTRH